jgi:hypothetical protein
MPPHYNDMKQPLKAIFATCACSQYARLYTATDQTRAPRTAR